MTFDWYGHERKAVAQIHVDKFMVQLTSEAKGRKGLIY